jgi:3-oxoacyl-[acyl-carrier protein] reductase
MRTVLVTGASRGIGAAIAKKFGKLGYRVCVNYNKSESDANKVVDRLKQLGALAKAYKADVADASQVKAMFLEIEKDFGGVDILINNAGVSLEKMLCDTTDEDYEHLMGVNLKGVFNCSREAQRYMVKEKRGAIVNISSIWGEVGASCETLYSASKAGVIGFTKALAKELAPSGITVNCLSPGAVDTDMNAFLTDDEKSALIDEIPLSRFATASEIASAVVFLCEHPYITGQNLSVNGGIVI